MPTAPEPQITVPAIVTTADATAELVAWLSRASRIALDLEANGRFAYRARVCTLQIAAGRRASVESRGDDARVFIVDAIAIPSASMGALAAPLGEAGPIKVVHDVAFDARMFAEAGIELGNVHDTSICAQMLGRPATGLASLAASELGVTLDKSLQSHDWSERPLDPAMLSYLASDVLHLEALDDKLWAEARTLGIEAEVLEETRYRLASAISAVRAPDPRPPYLRVKGLEKLGAVERAIVRRAFEAREREAERLDVPAAELVATSALVAIAEARPPSVEALRRLRGAMPRWDPYAVAREIVRAVALGVADADVPPEDRDALDRPRLASPVVRARRARESLLIAWRKTEALRRKVNEQVVLPGHCVKDIAELESATADDLARVRGIGAFRLARDAEAILRALAGAPPTTALDSNLIEKRPA